MKPFIILTNLIAIVNLFEFNCIEIVINAFKVRYADFVGAAIRKLW